MKRVVSGSRRALPQHGGVVVVVSLCILGIALVIGLAVETFRMLTSQLQLQNIAEYSTEVVLAEMLTGTINQPQIAERVSTVSNNNKYLAQAGGSDYGEIDAGDFSFNDLGSSAGVKVLTGCYNPSTNVFACAPVPSCVAPAVSAYMSKSARKTAIRRPKTMTASTRIAPRSFPL